VARRYRPTARGVFAVTGVLLIGAGIAVAARLGVFFVHSSTAGGALVRQERNAISGAGADGPLEAPSLGLGAPVLQGTGDGVLGEAVGHDPASVWPGQTGTSVLSAHDVTWFSGIAQLKPGATVRYVTPCWTSTFAVTAHVIVQADSPVYNTSAARLVLRPATRSTPCTSPRAGTCCTPPWSARRRPVPWPRGRRPGRPPWFPHPPCWPPKG
jgi:hypothetical protein